MDRSVVLDGGVPLAGPQEELRGPGGCTPRGFTSNPKQAAKLGFSGFIAKKKQKRKKSQNQTKQIMTIVVIIIMIIIIIVPIPKSITNIQIHHFKTTMMRARSIARVLFDSVRGFQGSFLLHTTCVRFCCNWRPSCVAAKHQKKKALPGEG